MAKYKRTETTILCPAHKQPIKVVDEATRQYAVCTCNVPADKHTGQVVFEKLKEVK